MNQYKILQLLSLAFVPHASDQPSTAQILQELLSSKLRIGLSSLSLKASRRTMPIFKPYAPRTPHEPATPCAKPVKKAPEFPLQTSWGPHPSPPKGPPTLKELFKKRED